MNDLCRLLMLSVNGINNISLFGVMLAEKRDILLLYNYSISVIFKSFRKIPVDLSLTTSSNKG